MKANSSALTFDHKIFDKARSLLNQAIILAVRKSDPMTTSIVTMKMTVNPADYDGVEWNFDSFPVQINVVTKEDVMKEKIEPEKFDCLRTEGNFGGDYIQVKPRSQMSIFELGPEE